MFQNVIPLLLAKLTPTGDMINSAYWLRAKEEFLDMNVEIRAHVLQLLKDYPEREREIALLRYELEHPTQISLDEMIDSMSFSAGDNTSMSKNHVSNKTLYIALNYQQKVDKINKEVVDEIATRLMEWEEKQSRLNNYVSLLDKRQQTVIRMYYFERQSPKVISESLGVSEHSVRYIKTDAIDKLSEMYEFTGITE